MATIVTSEPTTAAAGDQRVGLGDQRVVLGGVGWEGYEEILKLKGERRSPKVVYLDGSLTFVSPSPLHERMTRCLSLFIFILAEDLGIDCIGTRSTTFRQGAKAGGIEGDETFYFEHWRQIRGKKEIDLRTDPPPDLAIEAVVSHDADDAIEVWRRFGVPELWICDPGRLTILQLSEEGQYKESSRSRAIPFVEADEIHAWVTRDEDETDQAWARAVRRWVAEVLVPRARELAAHSPSPKDEAGNPEPSN